MDSEGKKIRWETIEKRLSFLEAVAHPSVNWEKKIKSLEDAYERLYNLIKDKIGD
tara:strand:+ start:275 stop:439 length:165 start_codon:yes stop_codon:yes gene_type:complete